MHEAYALPPRSVDALTRVVACRLDDDFEGLARVAQALPEGVGPPRRTPLDVRALRAVRRRVIGALRSFAAAEARLPPAKSKRSRSRTPIDPAPPEADVVLARLSLAPRDVSADAERALVHRSMRLARLVELDAPAVIVANEAEMIASAIDALDAIAVRAVPAEGPLASRELVTFAEDRSVALSLGAWGTLLEHLIDLFADTGRDPSVVPHPCDLALGRPLVALPDFAHPTDRMLERALAERGEWAEDVERSAFVGRYGDWVDWHVSDGREACARLDTLRAVLASLTEKDRRRLARDVPSDGATRKPRDWIPLLDAQLARCIRDHEKAYAKGYLIVSRAERSLC
jgi:hypothetical protein